MRFTFLHPDSKVKGRTGTNAQSCVLLVQGREHSALLPGDIGAAEERQLLEQLPEIDVVLAAHHGSATSSSPAFVQTVQARHVIAQVGYLSRFRHPARAVQLSWQRAGAAFWRSDWHGAVITQSSAKGLQLSSYREQAKRYWHTH